MTLTITLQHHAIAVNRHQSVARHRLTEPIAMTIQDGLLGASPQHQPLQAGQRLKLPSLLSGAASLQGLRRILQNFTGGQDAATG